jgi:hypothetical protein
MAILGVEHFLDLNSLPPISLNSLMVVGISPPPLFTYLSGIVVLGAGLCVMAKSKASFLSIVAIVMFVIFMVIYLPLAIANPSYYYVLLKYFVDTLVMNVAVLLFAGIAQTGRQDVEMEELFEIGK